jgi:hypothetical protein
MRGRDAGGGRCGAAVSIQHRRRLLCQSHAAIGEIRAHAWIVCVVLQTLHHGLIVLLQRCVVAIRAHRAVARQITAQIGIAGRNAGNRVCRRRGRRGRCLVLARSVAAPSH